MRVAVVSAWEPWRLTDGAAFVLAHQLRHLAARHEITVLAAGAPSAAAEVPARAAELLPGIDLRWFGTGESALADFAARTRTSWRSGEPSHVGFVERPQLVTALDELVAGGIDLLHLHGWGTAQLGARAANVPAVHMAIDPWTTNLRNRRLPAYRRLAGVGEVARARRHERRHYPPLAAVVVVSEPDAEFLRDLCPQAHIEVVANGVDPGAAPAPIPDGPAVLGFHGVFDSQANVDAARHLVGDIWPLVRQRVPDARVLLVGRRPSRSVRRLLTAGVELRPDVEDLRSELDRMSVHVDWMTSGAGIKNKVLEAMAAARPVVASAAGAAGIGPGPGLLVSPDVAQAANAAVDLLTNPVRMRDLGAAGRERVIRDFSWEASAAALEAVWERAVTGRLRR